MAVIIPSGALAWLALRSLHDEQLVLKDRQAQLYQTVADSFTRQALGYISERQREFGAIVEGMLANSSTSDVANQFDERLRKLWNLGSVGFAVSLDGNVLSPNMLGRAEGRRFRVENDKFLCSRETIEVYVPTVKGNVNLKSLDDAEDKSKKSASKISSSETDFRKIVGEDSEGILARFLQNNLNVLMWYRSPREPKMIFGAQLDLAQLRAGLRRLVENVDGSLRDELCVAVIDETGRPVAVSDQRFRTDWKHPFASGEIGEMLPHWEVAVYPLDPAKLRRAASSVKWTLGAFIASLTAAILIGSLLVLFDLRRELKLARQKSDFVSNVSHELKTPLTSIRMFSEMLAEGRVIEVEKQKNYLRIIGSETARLTRLINNILDFARMEKGEKKYNFETCDLSKIAREAIENYRPQLEAHGFRLDLELPSAPVLVQGDCDALAQVILNLLSNAEKYSADRKEIRIELNSTPGSAELGVLDRGLGVPAGSGEKIFEQFYRAHDSLSSGTQGSGLGLTLARQIARAHNGDVTYEPRSGGGSAFTLKLPSS